MPLRLSGKPYTLIIEVTIYKVFLLTHPYYLRNQFSKQGGKQKWQEEKPQIRKR